MWTLNSAIDDISRQILHELQHDARLSYSEIGRRVALTAPAVAERIHRMEEMGIITGYRAQVDSEKLGFPITAFIQVTSSRGECQPIADLAQNVAGVVECYHITGEKDVLLKGSFPSVRELEELVESLTRYGNVTTSLILSQRFHQPLGCTHLDTD